MPKAKAPARLISTNGFILGRRTLLSAGMSPHRLHTHTHTDTSAHHRSHGLSHIWGVTEWDARLTFGSDRPRAPEASWCSQLQTETQNTVTDTNTWCGHLMTVTHVIFNTMISKHTQVELQSSLSQCFPCETLKPQVDLGIVQIQNYNTHAFISSLPTVLVENCNFCENDLQTCLVKSCNHLSRKMLECEKKILNCSRAHIKLSLLHWFTVNWAALRGGKHRISYETISATD